MPAGPAQLVDVASDKGAAGDIAMGVARLR
jgi:hypothetical protein